MTASTRGLMTARIVSAVCLGAVAAAAGAQDSSAVPPSRTANEQLQSSQEAFRGVKTGLDGANKIVQGTRWGAEAGRTLPGISKAGAESAAAITGEIRPIAKGFDKGARQLKRADQVITFTRGCADLNAGDCSNAVGEIVYEEAVDRAFTAACAETGPAFPTCKAAVITGKLIRTIPLDGKRSLGDAVDDLTWKYVAEPLHNLVTTGYLNPLSDEAMEERIKQARENLRRNFEQAQRENERDAQAKAFAAQQAAMYSTPATPPSAPVADPLAGLNQVLQQMNQQLPAVKNYTPTSPAASTVSTSRAACVPATSLDPKTGCHPGHDEKNHPGGCKCSSGSGGSAQMRLQ